jgi:TonB family protein
MLLAARVAIMFVPFVSPAQTVLDDPGVTVDAGATLLHRAPVRHPPDVNGTVTLEASLNAKGEVTDAHVLSGPDDLRKEALSSVLQWHYSPGLPRVLISMRFDPAAPAMRGELAAGVVGGFGGGVPGGRSGTPPPPARLAASNRTGIGGTFIGAGALPQNTRLSTIEISGFSAEGERELRNLLPFREGELVTSTDIARASAAVTEFDSHASLAFTTGNFGNNSEVLLGIRISPQAGSQILIRAGRLADAVPSAPAPPPPPPPPPPPGDARIGPGMTPPLIIDSVEAEYSEAASKARFQGTVRLSIVVDQSGQPTQIKVISPLGLGLDQKAIEAVQRWRFRPGTKDGQPVAVQAAVEVNFRLPN